MPRKFFRFILAGIALAAVAFPSAARAYITRFDLSGIVTDGTGGVLPGVTVSLKNADTGFTRSTVTDDGGRYSFNALPPTGKWTLTAELPGFGTQHREGLEFQANTRPEINFQLNVGGVQESITVAASSPLVRTRESELSAILDAKQVDALPTNGRNFLSLLQTSGSVVPTGTGSSALSVNGQGIRMANFVADGVTKTGTNTMAGSAYGFWRPSAMVAANLLTGAKTTQKRKQFGGTIGGPLRKDVMHYFANYEDTDIDDAVVVTSALAPGTFAAPQKQKQGFFKLNNRFSDRTSFDARYSFNRNKQEAQSVGGLNTFERRSNTEGRTDAFVTSLLSNFGSNKVNEARFRYTFDVVDFYSPLTASSGAASRTPDFSSAPVTVTYTGLGN